VQNIRRRKEKADLQQAANPKIKPKYIHGGDKEFGSSGQAESRRPHPAMIDASLRFLSPRRPL
jgi:hypothetical protein